MNIKEDLIGPARKRELLPLSLTELLRETVASMGLPKEVVGFDFAPDVPEVLGDHAQFNNVFSNLIKNAMEAMEDMPTQRLTLRVHRSEEQPHFVVAHVTDSGCGIPPDQIDKIWMAFYTTKAGRGGTGLGLPACAQIVGQAGGKITIQSEMGVGTTFSVHLPAVEG